MEESIYKAVENRDTSAILEYLQLQQIYGMSEVHDYTYESCSFVVGLADMKTCIEVCFCPQGIERWEEPENPIFNKEK